ncbi:amino acid adenylation domain-containing protein [Streptomyces sp. NPDC050610]|uniref:amino acid adenylation domain-containing protein n=1 Tax=Streptomyces sp. NPDC050610 TaxID=3157097 RepID=UPI0034146C37
MAPSSKPEAGRPAAGLARNVLAQARRTPAAVAVADGATLLDYAGLDAASAAVARALRHRGVGPGQAVAVCLPRSWQLICAMLGILRLGAAVVPLDAQSPPARRRHILADSASVAVIHGAEAPAGLPEDIAALEVAELLDGGSDAGGLRAAGAAPELPCSDAAFSFLFYTSGTTGLPKGVEVRDAGILRLARPGYLRLPEAPRFAGLSNPAFDALSFEVWVPLLTGGSCVILDDATVQDPDLLAAALERERIDALFMTAALFNAVVDKAPHCFSGVGQVLVGGEQLNARLIRRWYRDNPACRTQLVNGYGPTETSTFAVCHPIPRDFDGEVVPIGRVLPGTEAVPVVDGARLAETGEAAELLITGEALANGYRNLPDETARRFVRLPWLDGGRARYYRTGDLVRQDATGLITYVGRLDRQVKVRGFRIEPGEIEARITAHAAVRQAHVCTRRDAADAANELLAYLVLGADLSFDDFDRHLAAALPAYMRPHRVHRVDELPRNANGKVDEAALLRRADTPWRRAESDDTAATGHQREVLDLAGQVLGASELRLGDRWIANGGDSLKALRLRFEVRRRWGREVPQALVLRATFEELAAAIAADRDENEPPYPVPAPPSGARSAPATSEQQRLWLLQQRDPHSRAYNVGLAFRLEGTVDTDALRHSLRRLVARHAALRTAFEAAPEGLRQVVAEPYDPWTPVPVPVPVPVPMPLDAEAGGVEPGGTSPGSTPRSGTSPGGASPVGTEPGGAEAGVAAANSVEAGNSAPRGAEPDSPEPGGPGASSPEPASGEAEWRAVADRFFGEPFDLGRPRMFQACWLPAEGSGGVLLLRLHHIAVDGWSLNVIFRELSADYAAALSGTEHGGESDDRSKSSESSEDRPAPTPLDYAAWQADWFAQPAYGAQRAALAEHYGDGDPDEAAPPLDPSPVPARGTGRLLYTTLGEDRRRALDALGAELGLTRFQVLLGVFAWSLYGVTGRGRPRIAGPVANRPVQDFESGVGMFANTVLLPLDLDPAEGLRAQLRRHGADARRVLDRQDVALADVLADQGPRTDGPPFDFMFVLENTDFDTLALPGSRSRPLWPVAADAKCPLTLSVVERGTGFDCLWEYADGQFDAAEVRALDGLFRRALDSLAEGGTDTLAELVAPYRRGLPDPGRAPALSPDFATVADGFARQVRRTPDAPALTSGDRTLSYAELDAYAAALAAELRTRFPLPADDGLPRRVALHFEPSVEHVVALLALARLNLTIVPLDPSYPPALLRQILDQVEPLCVLVAPGGEAAVDAIAPAGLPRHPVVLSSAAAPQPPPHDGRRPLYTLFTSGSTGTPKGVQVPDRTLCDLLHWQTEAGGLPGGAVTQQFSMLSFDVSFQEVFGTLCGGGRLTLVRPSWRQDAPALLEQLEEAGVERVFMPYVALQLLAEHGVRLGRFPSRLREVVTAGEQLLCTDAIRRWFAGMPGARLFNHYGPSETHVVSALRLDGDPARWPARPSVGRPVAGAWLRVVDEAGEPVPPGCPGRLLIGGTMVTPCYLGDPALNEERFVKVPGLGTFYRSGDRARFDRDGLLHYLGRDDQQIKLSGYRLELGQIEAALLRHPDIVNAVVVRDGERLTACLQCRTGAPRPTREALTAHLAPLLPPYARIDRFRLLDALPLTPSGKLDRRQALTAPGEELRPRAAAAPVRSARENRLTELFEEVVGRPIGLEERFFDAGATSLDLMRFHLRCTAEPELGFTIPDLFEHVTIGRLARFLDDRAATATAAATAEATAPETAGAADEPVAVVGMAVRLPGADDLASFWEMVESGGRGIEHFDAADGLVGARSWMSGLLSFDPEHFGLSRQEARLMDPQQRHLLMASVQALAHAGITGTSWVAEAGEPANSAGMAGTAGAAGSAGTASAVGPARTAGTAGTAGTTGAADTPSTAKRQRIGIVAGCGENTYYQSMLRDADPNRLPDGFQLALHHEKDFLATKVAYHLDLTGPALTVQASCASSLAAVHVAAGLLRQGDAEVMLAGGVLIDTLLGGGYRYRPQHIFSKDGHCRPFSDDASGTIGGSGVGVVVLKPLRLARRDGDTVYAVIKGSALNNDGSGKLSYSAPSLAGQREAIRTALRRSGRGGADVGYVEAHGTGTQLGDPVEVGALRQAFGPTGPESCALASVKSQIGHLGAASGVIGLVRAALAVRHGVIPPNVDFHRPNPRLAADLAPFRIPTRSEPWPAGRPRVAAVSSFGIGGTNAHLVLEAAESAPPPAAGPCLMLSSSSTAGLRADALRVADYLTARPEAYGQVLRHLQAGRVQRRLRAATVLADAADAAAWLREVGSGEVTPSGASRPSAASGPSAASQATRDRATQGERLPDEGPLRAEDLTPEEAAAAWLAGAELQWPAGPASAPWDFPPPAFALADYDFERAAPKTATAAEAPGAGGWEMPPRLPEADWLHQPHWVRLSRATAGGASAAPGLLVAMTAAPLPPEALRPFAAAYERVVRVSAAGSFARLGDDVYEVDPADPASLRQLLDELSEAGAAGVDWLHALPLSVDGPVGEDALARAQWACVDTPAALLQAVGGLSWPARLRPWWLSHQAQPVEGAVRRPESSLLAGVCEVAPQECAVDGHWLDLPSADPADWAPLLPALLAGADAATALPRRLALRQGYWWRQALLPVPGPAPAAPFALPARGGTYLILGGTGGIGASIAAWLLEERPDCRALLLSRRPELPADLAPWADRVELIEADLAEATPEEIMGRLDGLAYAGRIDGVVHAAGAGAGGLIARRDAPAMRRAMAAKLRGALLVERLIERHRPVFAAYCSSMAALFGGVGQLDYAAAAGLLDGFARHRAGEAETTVRIGVDWDIWSEVGMARHALRSDPRHQAHLTVGLAVKEGQRLFAQALQLQLPQLLVSTTDIERARGFYAPDAGAPKTDAPKTDAPKGGPSKAGVPSSVPGPDEVPAPATTAASAAERLSTWLCDWLGLDGLDPAASLYDHGADSLTLLDLIGEVKDHFGVDLELSQLSHQVSLAEVLARLDEAAPAGPSAEMSTTAAVAASTEAPVTLEVWQPGEGRDVLCLVHPVGGDIQAYRALVSALDPRLTVCLIADPGLLRPHPPAWSLAERARRYHAALEARFPHSEWRRQLAGWSFGAWVAQSMAAEAEAAGRPAAGLYLVDPPPPDAGPHFAAYDETQLEAVFAHELGQGGAGAPASQEAAAYAERLARCCRANLAGMAGHEPPPLSGTPSRLWLAGRPVAGLPALGSAREQQRQWRALLPEPAGSYVLDTTHYGIVRPPGVRVVADAINAASLPDPAPR